jgi:hypothetical protein
VTRALLVAAAIVAGVAVLSFHSVCDLLFACGCRPLWAGGTAGCNIHQPGVPHCPFCTGGLLRLSWIAGLTGACALGAIALAVRRRRGAAVGVVAGLCGYLLGATLAGLLAALHTGYPRLLGWVLR